MSKFESRSGGSIQSGRIFMMRKWFEVYRRSAQGWVKIRVINSDDIEAARAARDEARGLDTASEYEIRSYCEEVVV